MCLLVYSFFFFQAEDGIRGGTVTGVQTCALPILEGTGDTKPGYAAWRVFAYVHSVEQDRPAVGSEIASDHVDEGGLTCAVGADQADLLTGRNIEGKCIGRNYCAKALLEPAHR